MGEHFPELRTYMTLDGDARAADADGSLVTAIISTGDLARDGAVIRTAGWDFKAFNRNPVVLFGHDDRGLPIAKSSRPRIEGRNVLATADFDMDDPFAVQVLGKIRKGLLSAVSVRWQPLEVARETQKVDGKDEEIFVFVRQELLEWSIVPIPADAKALIKRADGGRFCVDDFCGADHGEHPDRLVAARQTATMAEAITNLTDMCVAGLRLDEGDMEALRGLHRDLTPLLDLDEEPPMAPTDARVADLSAVTQAVTDLATAVGALAGRVAQRDADPLKPLVEAVARKTGRSLERVRQDLGV